MVQLVQEKIGGVDADLVAGGVAEVDFEGGAAGVYAELDALVWFFEEDELRYAIEEREQDGGREALEAESSELLRFCGVGAGFEGFGDVAGVGRGRPCVASRRRRRSGGGTR